MEWISSKRLGNGYPLRRWRLYLAVQGTPRWYIRFVSRERDDLRVGRSYWG